MNRQATILLLLLSLILSAFTGCGPKKTVTGNMEAVSPAINATRNSHTGRQIPADGPKTVKLALLNGMVEMVDFFNDYFERYSSENSDGIRIQTDYQKEATKVLQVKLASGNAPDIIAGITPTQSMMDQGSFVELSCEKFWNQLNPLDKEYNTDMKSGRIYGVGLCRTAIGLFYNKTIFRELGLKPANTWTEFTANLMTIKQERPDIVPFYIGGRDSWMLQHMSNFIHGGIAKQKMSYTSQQKAMLEIDLDKLGWNVSPGGTLVTYVRDLMELEKSGLINEDAVKATYNDQLDAFAAGKAAVISQGLWAAELISERAGDLENIGFSQYPAIMEGEKPVVGTGTDVILSIYAGSGHVDACRKVLYTLLQPDSMKEISEGRKAPSANPGVQSDWGFLKNDVNRVLNDPSIAVVTWTTMPAWFTGDDEGRMWQDLLVGKYRDPVDFARAYINAWYTGKTD